MNVDDYRRMRLALEDRLWGNRESRERAEQGNEILEMIGRDMRAWSDEFAYLTRGIPDMDANVAELQDGVNRSMLDIAYGCDERLQELDAERRSIEDHMESLDGDNTSAAAGAKSTADAIRSLMAGAATEVNLDAAAISGVAGDFAAWDELMSR